MPGNAQARTTIPPTAARAGVPRRGAAAGAAPARGPHRLDDLVREVGGRGFLGGRAAPFLWGFGGFLIGAIFWHLIGFWSFLSGVVLKGPEPQVSVIARPVAAVMLPNCVALALNRATGQTYSVPCAEQEPLLEEARGGRQDLAFAEARLRDAVPPTFSPDEPDVRRLVRQEN